MKKENNARKKERKKERKKINLKKERKNEENRHTDKTLHSHFVCSSIFLSLSYSFSRSLSLYKYIYVPAHWSSGRLGFNPRSRHTNDLKMVLDTSLHNIQQYKVRIDGKME